jgi:hypothetical protein
MPDQIEHIRELEAELDRLRRELREVTDKYQRAYAVLVLHTEGVFTLAEYIKIWKALHPDHVGEAERARYTEAAAIFSRCERLVKKEPPPRPPDLPKTFEELMEARRQVKAENSRRAKAAWAKRKSKGRLLRDGRTDDGARE